MDYLVKNILKYKGKTVAYSLYDELLGIEIQVSKRNIHQYKGHLSNAIITETGIVRGLDCKLGIVNLKNYKQTKVNYEYKLMYKDTIVLTWDKQSKEVKILNKGLLPFGLRRLPSLSVISIHSWLKDRTTQLSRTYMNLVYIVRNVGRDTERIVSNSNAISITDNYWVKDKATANITWGDIKKSKDIDKSLCEVALKGIKKASNEGRTSLFTAKGYYPKAILGNYMYKTREAGLYDYVASHIGKQLGLDIQTVELRKDLVKIQLFTDEDNSLVHTRELMQYLGVDRPVYDVVKESKFGYISEELEKMYIFNYLIGNSDLHDENYGFIYDSDTFKLKKLAPLYDHNNAFHEEFGDSIVETIGGVSLGEYSRRFAKKHKNLIQSLSNINYTEIEKYLSELQIKEFKKRISDLQLWVKE